MFVRRIDRFVIVDIENVEVHKNTYYNSVLVFFVGFHFISFLQTRVFLITASKLLALEIFKPLNNYSSYWLPFLS